MDQLDAEAAAKVAKEDRFFCYGCQAYHPKSEMVVLLDRRGQKKKRCRASIDAAKRAAAERDAYGKRMTSINQSITEKNRFSQFHGANKPY